MTYDIKKVFLTMTIYKLKAKLDLNVDDMEYVQDAITEAINSINACEDVISLDLEMSEN
tara:strand:- start:153 stop:329 length:177 start_codon:yes stop_codon:yes gene_type:complete